MVDLQQAFIRTGSIIMVGGMISWAVYMGSGIKAMHDNYFLPRIKQHIQEALPRHAREQEQRFDIQYETIPPVRVMDIPGAAAAYDPATDKISVSSYSLPDTLGWAAKALARLAHYDFALDSHLEHELGHAYTDQLLNRRLATDLSTYMIEEDTEKEFNGKSFIVEGIGTYFAQSFPDPSAPLYLPEEWPKLVITEEMSENDRLRQYLEFHIERTRLLYDTSSALLKPVLDISVEEGSAYLLSHPPDVKSPRDLPAYFTQAEREVRNIVSARP